MNNTLQKAIDLAERGLRIFPCHPNKVPATNHGFHDATTDRDRLRTWFHHSNYLIGVCTGPENGLFVLDIDPDGREWLAEHNDKLRCERIHHTKRGRHFIYKWSDYLTTSTKTTTAGAIGPGIDTRGTGGYIIWWPAHDQPYVGDLEQLTSPPYWLIQTLSTTSKSRFDQQPNPNGITFKEGERNTGLARLAGSLRRQGLDEKQLTSQLNTFNLNSCLPPLPVHEIEVISRSIGRYEVADPLKPKNTQPTSSLEWLGDFEMTEAEVNAINDPDWVIQDLAPEGHVVAVAAPPGAGKTTILFHLCKSLSVSHTVIYVHADTNPSDAKDYYLQAKAAGIRYLTPDMKVGLSMGDVVKRLETLAASDADLRGHLWVFDTLKKMVDMIQKKSLKHLLQTMRKLSNRGMTVILLAHTNKHKDEEGKTVFEGTGDLKSDVDELIYLDPLKQADGVLVVSTRPDKVRADIQPLTFEIDTERRVTSCKDFVDVPEQIAKELRREKDAVVIDLIHEALAAYKHKQIEIIGYCKETAGIGEHRVRAALKHYAQPGSSQLWTAEKQFQRNTWRYRPIQSDKRPF